MHARLAFRPQAPVLRPVHRARPVNLLPRLPRFAGHVLIQTRSNWLLAQRRAPHAMLEKVSMRICARRFTQVGMVRAGPVKRVRVVKRPLRGYVLHAWRGNFQALAPAHARLVLVVGLQGAVRHHVANAQQVSFKM